METQNFWNIKTNGAKSQIDLFGLVGGSKQLNNGFNEADFLNEFRNIPADNALDVSVNSCGGSVFAALSVYETLKSHKGPVTIRVNGVAMSAATLITSVPNGRVIMPHGAMMMIHCARSSARGTSVEMQKAAETTDKIDQNMVAVYARKTGRSPEEIKAKMDAETYFTAEEAVEFGLADEIDESQTVTNVAEGDFVNCNGLQVEAGLFSHAPEGFFNAEASATKPKEKTMDLETLKAEHSDLVEMIRAEALKEGVDKERARIQAIEDIAVAGYEDMVIQAKFETGVTAEALAVAILKKEKESAEAKFKAEAEKVKAIALSREKDAAVMNEAIKAVGSAGNEGLMPNSEMKAENDMTIEAIVAAGKKGYARK